MDKSLFTEIIRKYKWLFIAGLILRLIIAGITFHPDGRILSWTPRIILYEGQINFYDYTENLTTQDPNYKVYKNEEVDDLPLHHLIRLPIDLLIRPLINNDIEKSYLEDSSKLFGDINLMFLLVLSKFQLIIFDLVLGVLIAASMLTENRAKALMIWMFNPISLWATAGVGQIDIIPTFFLFTSYFLLTKNKSNWSALTLGIGAAIKSFPFLVAPFLIFSVKGWKKRLILTGLIITPFIISILPFIQSRAFRYHALFAPQLDKSLYARIPISGGEGIILSLVVLIAMYLIYLRKERGSQDYLIFLTTTLLSVLALTHFHIQWFLWITPFLLILYIQRDDVLNKYSLGTILISVLVMLFLFDASLQLRLFAPLFPGLNNMQGLTETLLPDQLTTLRSFVASIFAAGVIIFNGRLLINHEK